MEPAGETSAVRAQVPLSEMLNYEPHLRSMSGGRGSYSMEFDHYEELPAMLLEKVVAEARKEKEAKAAEKH
jgi:elongation factor G